MYIYIYPCVCAFMYLYIQMSMLYMHRYTYVYVYPEMYLSVCITIDIYPYMSMYIYTHIHSKTSPRAALLLGGRLILAARGFRGGPCWRHESGGLPAGLGGSLDARQGMYIQCIHICILMCSMPYNVSSCDICTYTLVQISYI